MQRPTTTRLPGRGVIIDRSERCSKIKANAHLSKKPNEGSLDENGYIIHARSLIWPAGAFETTSAIRKVAARVQLTPAISWPYLISRKHAPSNIAFFVLNCLRCHSHFSVQIYAIRAFKPPKCAAIGQSINDKKRPNDAAPKSRYLTLAQQHFYPFLLTR